MGEGGRVGRKRGGREGREEEGRGGGGGGEEREGGVVRWTIEQCSYS